MLNHKILLTTSMLAAAIALSACQPKQAEPKEEPVAKTPAVVEDLSLKLIGDSEKLSLALPECDGNSCPDLSISRLSSNQAFIDEVIDEEILKKLAQILDVSPQNLNAEAEQAASEPAVAQSKAQLALASVETPKQKIEQKVAPYLANFLALDKELKALSANHQISLMIKPRILNADLPLATVVLNASSYLGGAHGSSSQRYYNFDLKQKKQVQLNDIIAPNQKAALQQKAHEAFRAWIIESKLADSVEEYEQAWKFSLSDNFYLSNQGLILQYAEYEIGPYVVGLPRLTLPYDQLQSILKPAYLPQSQPDAAAPASAAVVPNAKP